jgi:hypothetical protein
MAASRTKFHERIKGPYREKEDWWHLIEDSGQLSVEHEWSHSSLGNLKTDSDTKTMTVEEFLASDAPNDAKEALRKLLDARG